MLKGLLSRAKTKVRGLAGGIASGSVPGDATPGADLALERPRPTPAPGPRPC